MHHQLPYHMTPSANNPPNSRIMAAVAATQQAVASSSRAPKRHKNSATPPSSGISEIGEPNPPQGNNFSGDIMPPPVLVQRSRSATTSEVTQSAGIEPITPSSLMGLDMRNPPRQTRRSNGSLNKSTDQTRVKPPSTPVIPSATIKNSTNAPTGSTSGSRSAASRSKVPQSPPQGPKKHTHKDAEQKRRDSLKTSFDELRDLLPPIPLALEDPRFADAPPLPGSLPPRGPPKGDTGPNRHVSKLHVLRCGNDFIRQLKGRVERRDKEIEMLRMEVGRLLSIVGFDSGGGEIDLEKDLDAEEDMRLGLGEEDGMGTVMEEGEDGDES